jgi:hypothetical protein
MRNDSFPNYEESRESLKVVATGYPKRSQKNKREKH